MNLHSSTLNVYSISKFFVVNEEQDEQPICRVEVATVCTSSFQKEDMEKEIVLFLKKYFWDILTEVTVFYGYNSYINVSFHQLFLKLYLSSSVRTFSL